MTSIMQKQSHIPHGDARPSALYITQGSFGIMSTVELRDNTLYYSATCNSEPVAINRLNSKRWQSFRKVLEYLKAEQWEPNYLYPNVLDGQQWAVKIAYADGRLIESRDLIDWNFCSRSKAPSAERNFWNAELMKRCVDASMSSTCSLKPTMTAPQVVS